MTASEFLNAFAAEVGGPIPTPAELDVLLELASIAAHGSERVAAPLSCWIGGASGRPVSELLAAAQRVLPATGGAG
jgi:hypothetical protein